jgi:hypothetical protein
MGYVAGQKSSRRSNEVPPEERSNSIPEERRANRINNDIYWEQRIDGCSNYGTASASVWDITSSVYIFVLINII